MKVLLFGVELRLNGNSTTVLHNEQLHRRGNSG